MEAVIYQSLVEPPRLGGLPAKDFLLILMGYFALASLALQVNVFAFVACLVGIPLSVHWVLVILYRKNPHVLDDFQAYLQYRDHYRAGGLRARPRPRWRVQPKYGK